MAFHPDITRKDDVTVALDAANAAVRIASKQLTGNAGTVEIPNADGTSTIMGAGAGDTGVATWVGDTTAPGKPLGITAESHNGSIWVSWNGTLDGGVPADFDHVQFTAVDGSKTVDMGQLKAAGKVTAAELTAGDTVTITAIAYDDAHAADGSPAPNASVVSDPVTVVVKSAVDAAQVQKAHDDAQNALDQAGQASDTATSAKNTAEGASTDAANATQTANDAKDTAATASSVAQSALSTAQSAKQDTVTQWVAQYAQTTSPKIAPTTGWSETPPDWVAGNYIWSRMIVAYGSGDYETTDAVVLTGNPGEQGVKGDPGANGRDGTSVTVRGRVSTAANLPSSASNGDGYITEDDGHLHVWGSTGFTDVGQFKGENGLNAYAHTAWANSADGKNEFSTTSGGIRAYMGQYNDNTVADSDDPTKYTWTKIKGSDGAQGVGVASITKYWALGTEAPAQPAVATPPSPWVPAEPGYQRDQNLYTTTKFTYDSGAFVYTNVQFDSSYQYSAAAETAARDALQSATNANTTAQTAKSTADNASSVATQANATAVSANQSATSAETAANLALANAQELVVNGGFETGDLTGWTAYHTDGIGVTEVANETHSGNYMLSGNLPTSPNAIEFLSKTFPVVPGRILRCSGWFWNDARATVANISIKFNDGSLSDKTDINSLGDGWKYASADVTVPPGVSSGRFRLAYYHPDSNTVFVRADDISVKDITEAKAAQKAAEDAQATADTANTSAKNAATIANAAKAAAQGAQTTADGKNKIFSSASEPAHTGLVPGDLWFQLDSSSHVTGIQVWNGSAFVDYLIVANQILVAGSVGTTQIKNGAITTDLLTSNAVTAIKIAANTITGDKLDVGSVAAAIVSSNKFVTDDGLKGFDSDNGYWIKDADGNYMFHANTDGNIEMQDAVMKGGDVTIGDPLHGQIHLGGQANDLGTIDFINNGSTYAQLQSHIYDNKVYLTLGPGAGHSLNFIYDEQTNKRWAGFEGCIYTQRVEDLPSYAISSAEKGTIGFVNGVRYVYDGNGSWQPYDTSWINLGYGNGYKVGSFGISPRIRISGGLVFMQGVSFRNSGSVTGGDTPFGVIPASYRPRTVTYAAVTGSAERSVNIQVNSSGTINVKGTPGGDYVAADGCWWALD